MHLPERRLTLGEQLARLSLRAGKPMAGTQGILDAQAEARTAIDGAGFDLDHVVERLRGIELLTERARALVGHVEAAPRGRLVPPADVAQRPVVRRAA